MDNLIKYESCGSKKRIVCLNEECFYCYHRSFLSVKESQYLIKELLDFNPRFVGKSSDKKGWFKCNICYHSIEVRLADITRRGLSCGYCQGKRLCEKKCERCFNKSFASHEKSKFLDPSKNIDPTQIFLNSIKEKLPFICDKCFHPFLMTAGDVNYNHWCPYCTNMILCRNDNCKQCENKSFFAHEISKYWNYKLNQDINPRDIFKGARGKYWFICDKCNHDFPKRLDDIFHKDSFCPYCAHRTICLEDCNFCFNMSFANHKKSKYWDYNKNKDPPRAFFINSTSVCWFKCKDGHSFDIKLNNITSKYNWCRFCKHKTEKMVYNYLVETYPQLTIIKEAKFEWCKNINYMPFDIYIEELKLLIEIDGRQHFQNIEKWYSNCIDIQNNDIDKMKRALNNNFSIMRLIQTEIYNNKYKWEKVLSYIIELNEINTLSIVGIDVSSFNISDIYEKYNVHKFEIIPPSSNKK